ncbi:MAG: alpha/beta hydrolase [Steroidobacteraceae bacterium]
MAYTTDESADSVVLNPSAPNAAVIWLHGLGADGFDFVPIVEELQLPATLPLRFVFPHARARPVTINNGFVMRAWYDITGLGGGRTTEDEAGIRESEGVLRGCIEQQLAAGIAAERIIIAGFSQGGAIALQTALRYAQRLGGVMALSTYLPLRQTLAQEASATNRDVPILMCHGSHDPMVPLALGEASRDALQGLGFRLKWRTYPMQHQVCMEEIADISAWLQARLTRNI